eukprot:2706412-Ditylum_brightwellii.AAC.1
MADTFRTGMLTFNFFNNYHLDEKDKDIPTHCSFSPPPSWNSGPSQSPNSVFDMGSVTMDISTNPHRISFLPEQVVHCTSEPLDIPTLPSFLEGKCCAKTLYNNRKEFYLFVSESMLAWGGWGWWNRNIHQRDEYNAVVEGVTDAGERCRRRRNLIEAWANIGYTRDAKGYQAKRSAGRNNNQNQTKATQRRRLN